MRRLAVLLVLLLVTATARAEDAISFGLDWVAEAEYGGYYQALATGIYARHGLKVTIRQGGPQVNQMQLMMAGRLDFNLGGGRADRVRPAEPAVRRGRGDVPEGPIGADRASRPGQRQLRRTEGQADPDRCRHARKLVALPRRQVRLHAMRRSGPTRSTCSRSSPTRTLVQQGYLGSEPFAIEQAAHFKPVVLLLADAGYAGYGNIVTTSTKLVTEKPDLVQRFIDASIEGWYSYLYGDPAPANRLIKQDNPEMTDALLTYGRDVMKTHGIVDSGDALKLGIGAMTDARWAEFYRSMADVGVYPKGLDVTKAYTLRFVDKRVGMKQ